MTKPPKAGASPDRRALTVEANDLWLFNEGTLENVASLLGARPKTIEGRSGFGFSVWAPNAERVAVVGDWNGWDPTKDPLASLWTSGVWEGFVPGLVGGEKYKLVVVSKDGTARWKSDPAARYAELRPKTASICLSERPYLWDDSTWLKQRERPEKDSFSRPVSIYEAHLPSWRRNRDGQMLSYRELAAELVPYVVGLGFTHIELVGLCEHPLDDSWGYQVTGYYAPTSRHGPPADFKYFVDRCHAASLGVIFDWVPAHFPTDDHSLFMFDGTHLFDHQDARQGAHRDWGTRIFNYGRKEVQSFLIGSLFHFLAEYHLDGARVDAVASMLYNDYSRASGEWVPNRFGGRESLEAIEFLREANRRVKRRFPGVLTIAEESTAWPLVTGAPERGGLGFDLKWNMGWMNDTLRWFGRDHVFRGASLDDLSNTLLWAHSERYVCSLSHDEVVHQKGSLLTRMPGDDWQKFANVRLLLSYQWAYPGHKLLFMGGEYAQRAEWDFRTSLSWGEADTPLHGGVRRLVTDLNALYRREPALYEREHEPEGIALGSRDHQNAVLSFFRRGRAHDQELLFVLNGTPQVHRRYRVGVDHPGTWIEVLNTDATDYGGSGVQNAPIAAEPVTQHTRAYSLELTLPPLSLLALRRAGDEK